MDLLLSKVLRIDVDHPDKGKTYSVPRDNPFIGTKGVRPETWAFGLRNPWRLSVDPLTGDIWVGNNGQDLWEQIYRVKKGDNYVKQGIAQATAVMDYLVSQGFDPDRIILASKGASMIPNDSETSDLTNLHRVEVISRPEI